MGLSTSHLRVPLDVVMGGVSVLNQGRVLCTRGSEQDCWQPALPEPVVLWGAGMVFLGGGGCHLLSPTRLQAPAECHLQGLPARQGGHAQPA